MQQSSILTLLVISLLSIISSDAQNYDMISVFGGKGSSRYDPTFFSGNPPGNCNEDAFAPVPFIAQHAIALRDSNGRPMVCGGNKNPNQKACFVYEVTNNTWLAGPEMKRKRVGASASCLPNGECWVFGGRSKSYTEWYNPNTGSFEMGPEMPVNSAFGLCTATAPSGLIYMVARRQPGNTKAFTFDPSTRTFKDLPSLGVERREAACSAMRGSDGGDEFVVIGGGVNPESGTDSTFIYTATSGEWRDGPNYPEEIYGAVALTIPSNQVLVYGGIRPDGVELLRGGTFDGNNWNFNYRITGPLVYSSGVNHEKACPPA